MTESSAAMGDDGEVRRGSSRVAAGILGSRLTGLLREMATARFLGTGIGAEAFKAALRIPNLLQNLLGEGVLSASFVPVYSKLLAEGRHHDAGRLAGAIAGLLLAVTSAIVTLAVAFAEPMTRLIAFGLEPGSEKFALTVSLVRIITPGVGLLVLSAWCLGILNSHRMFFLAYIAPALWNVAIVSALIAAFLFVSSEEMALATAMGIGALVGSLLQLLLQLPTVRRLVPELRITFSFKPTGVATVTRKFGQVLAGRGSVQLGSYVDLFAASLLAAGAFAAITYAQTLYLMPIALFGMSVAAAELPALSTMDLTDRIRVTTRLNSGLGRVAFFVLPTSVAFIIAGDYAVTLLFQGGRFSPAASVQVGIILSIYALGLPAATSSRLLQSALYGSGDARSPALYAAMRVGIATFLGVIAMLPLDAIQVTASGLSLVHDPGWSIASPQERAAGQSLLRLGGAGIALGATAGAWLELSLLRTRIRVLYGKVQLLGAHARSLQTAGAVAVAAGLAARWLVDDWELNPRIHAIIVLTAIGLSYLLTARALRIPEAKELLDRLRRRNP